MEDAEIIEQVKMVMLEITPEQALDNRLQHNLKVILQEQSGERNKAKMPVVAAIGQGKHRQFIRFGQKFWVQDDRATILSLQNAGFSAYAQLLLPT